MYTCILSHCGYLITLTIPIIVIITIIAIIIIITIITIMFCPSILLLL